MCRSVARKASSAQPTDATLLLKYTLGDSAKIGLQRTYIETACLAVHRAIGSRNPPSEVAERGLQPGKATTSPRVPSVHQPVKYGVAESSWLSGAVAAAA